MEVKPERIAEIIRKIDPNNNMSASELADAIMQDLEKDRKLSDLEIVQKALEKNAKYECRLAMIDCNKMLRFDSTQELLTWAKQQIGVE